MNSRHYLIAINSIRNGELLPLATLAQRQQRLEQLIENNEFDSYDDARQAMVQAGLETGYFVRQEKPGATVRVNHAS